MEISVMCYVTCSDVIVVDVHLVSCYVLLSNHLIIKEVMLTRNKAVRLEISDFKFYVIVT